MSDWLFNYFDEGLKNNQSEEKPEGWFNVKSVYNVPYINYCGLTSEQSQEVQQQIQNALRFSRNSNHFKETTIIYSLDHKRENHEIYLKRAGDVSSVKEDEIVAYNAESDMDLVVIGFASHGDVGPFSIQELAFFCAYPFIKLMVLVNPEGKVSYLLKTQKLDLRNVVMFHILDTCPDFQAKFMDWKQTHPQDQEFKITSIVKGIETQSIISREIVHDLQEKGVLRREYVKKENQDDTLEKDEVRVEEPVLEEAEVEETVQAMPVPEEPKPAAPMHIKIKPAEPDLDLELDLDFEDVKPSVPKRSGMKFADSKQDKDPQLGGALFSSPKFAKADSYYDNDDDGFAWGGPKEKIVEKKIVNKK